jgi:hypothetical protein
LNFANNIQTFREHIALEKERKVILLDIRNWKVICGLRNTVLLISREELHCPEIHKVGENNQKKLVGLHKICIATHTKVVT